MTAEDYAALRVKAAQDVLERIIPDENLEITTQCYLRVDYMTREPCKACAAGALTLAVIAPQVLGKTLAHGLNQQFLDHTGLDGDDLRPALLELFELDQLALIEAAFMCAFTGNFADRRFVSVDGPRYYASTIYHYHNAADLLDEDDLAFFRQLEAAVTFDYAYERDEERLAAIMTNIVKNNGTFVPEGPG